MFARMTGRQLAGWGYGIFWFGLLFETINTVVSAMSVASLSSSIFWIGQAVTLSTVIVSISMMMGIRHRPW